MSELIKPFAIRQIGEIQLNDGEVEAFYGVVLEGDIEAVRAVGAFFGESVSVVPRTPAPVRAEGEAITDEMRREIERDVKSKLRLAFRKALSELPEIAPREIASVLSSVHMQNEFLNEGKRLQRVHGTDAVAPRVEQECGAGAWSFMRQGIRAALKAEDSLHG